MTLPHRLLPGEEVNFKVYYEPIREGAAGGRLVMTTDVYTGTTTELNFTGYRGAAPPCQLEVTPAMVDFGTVEPGKGAVLGVKVRNRGADLCPVKNIRLQDNGGGVFGMPGGELDGVIIWPGDWFSFMVSFLAPRSGGSFTGTLQVDQADPANPRVLVPLAANSQAACLVAAPRYVDWGVHVRPVRRPRAR